MRKTFKEKPLLSKGLSFKDVKKFEENVDTSKYVIEKKPKFVKRNLFDL